MWRERARWRMRLRSSIGAGCQQNRLGKRWEGCGCSRRRHLRSRGWPPLDLFESPGSGIGGGPSADVIDMDRAYRQLSLKQRAAITLNYRHGYSVEECAAFMGCRPGTVRTHVARGLATLRKELGDA